MKVLMINGSPRVNGNTSIALAELVKVFESEGVETEVCQIGSRDIRGCIACGKCSELGRCVFDDAVNELAPKFEQADGLVVASPVYYASANATLIACLDRLFYSTRFNKTMKVGASVAVARRGGCSAAFDEMNKYFTICGMPVASSQYWNSVHGRMAGEAEQDAEGLQTMRVPARNMTFLMKSIALGKENTVCPKKRSGSPLTLLDEQLTGDTAMSNKSFTPTNADAQQCVKNVMKYLSDISYNKIVTGQHTQTMAMEELHRIKAVTGKEPALLGFELLSYSPNINYLDTDSECMTEVEENYGTLKRAWEWAQRGGLITFTWHWFSPLGGRSKSFFTKNTDFDASRAVIEGTAENTALIEDMDCMAGLLRPFCDKGVPILWRPFHEGEGDWFWWGAKGADVLKQLWRMMYNRFTGLHRLNNLIWVWNSPAAETYPGDDVVDIISRDMYPEKHSHTACEDMYRELVKITGQPKIVIIGETGTLPDVDEIHNKQVGWASFMTWSKVFCLTEEFNSFEQLKKLYYSPHAVTAETLPKLY